MAVGHIFTIGQGMRYQYTQDENGYWWKRSKLTPHNVQSYGWAAWTPLGTKTRPDNIWFYPGAGTARLPKEKVT